MASQPVPFLYYLATWHGILCAICNFTRVQRHDTTCVLQVRALGVIFVTQNNAIKFPLSFFLDLS